MRIEKAGTMLAALVLASGLACNVSATPAILTELPDITLPVNSAPTTIALASRYSDPGTSVMRFTFAPTTSTSVVFAPVDVAMFDSAKPVTVANFKSYVNLGRYSNTILHRTALYGDGQPFVIQGGGFRTPTLNNASPVAVTTLPAIVNEPGISNIKGTIAMAKVGGDPNSATSQWFFNLNNRNATDPTGALLDTQNGGFTVFGRVLNGQATLDQMATITRYDLSGFLSNGSLNECALVNPIFTPPTIRPADYINVQSITQLSNVRVVTFSATSTNTGLVQPSITGTTNLRLTLTPDATGTAFIDVKVTSPDTTFIVDRFQVTVPQVRCNPADIADGQGNPLPGSGFNAGVDGGDFDCFFNYYFEAAPLNAVADIADGVGDPLPPFGPGGGFNPGVDGGDFDCFFNYYFGPCI